MQAKILLMPIMPAQCKGKKVLFRPSGMYHVISEQNNRIVLKHEGASVTNDMTTYAGFYQPVAYIPELPQDEQYVPIIESDWSKVLPLLKVDSMGMYLHYGNNVRDVYARPLVEVLYNFRDGYVTL